ncbi:MAG TPA: ABC transporter substrate-binding protein [Candidatus Paceibacterota bacterium]|nr:ABC transporter substrate-binding protein [Candidatus Paceibacterota bacterium]
MSIFKSVYSSFTRKERIAFLTATAVFIIALATRGGMTVSDSGAWVAVPGGSWREGVVGQPVAINPIISDNPADLDLSRLIYANLLDLAENLEISDDGKMYAVKLKEDLLWDNGQRLTADDVVFTVEAIQDPETHSPLAKNWEGVVVERESEIRVNFSLPAPYAFFKENLARLPIIPVHIFGGIPKSNLRLSAYNLEPVGSGPYRLESFSKRKDGFVSDYRLVRNENFAGGRAFIKDFRFVFYESLEKMVKDFSVRKIHGFGTFSPLSNILPEGKTTVNRVASPGFYAVFFNENVNPILKEDSLRRALSLSVDKRRIVAEVLGNQAEAVFGPLGRWGAGEKLEVGSAYNIEEAKKEIAKLKKNDITLTVIVPQVDFLERAAEIIKEGWLAAGVKEVNIIPLPSGELLDNVIKTNNYEALIFGNVLENPLDLFPFWHSSQRFYPGLNLALYRNQKVDTLIEKVRQSMNEEERQNLAKQAEKIIVEDNPAIFLFSLPYNYVHSKNLGGFQFEAAGRYIVFPSDRFQKVEEWHTAKARIIE